MRKTKQTVDYRRKRKGLTDYKKRISLLSSGKNRLVVRFSNMFITAQIVQYEPAGDKVVAGANSKMLAKLGWKGSMKNIPAAYLTGLMLGKKLGKGEAVLDIGLKKSTKGSRLFAVAKGMIDAGITVACSEEVMPSDERMKGNHIETNAKQLKEKDQEEYKKAYSKYIKEGIEPEKTGEMFEKVKKSILEK